MRMPKDKGEESFHRPVMMDEVMHWLNVRPGAVVVDTTVGGGGHAGAVLAASAPGGRFIGIDRDGDAIEFAGRRLGFAGSRVRLVKGRMGEVAKLLGGLGVGSVDGVLADLGVSGYQLGQAGRGFSFMEDGPLDMRMDRTEGESASELIARSSAEELEALIRAYGEERFAGRMARALKSAAKVETTAGLAALIEGAVPSPRRRHVPHGGGRRIHPATRTFQALRIAVNDELGELERFLEAAPQRLRAKGRLVIISYHSLEDRRVKHAFRSCARDGAFGLPCRRAIRPSRAEVAANPRARSAKLRVLERI